MKRIILIWIALFFLMEFSSAQTYQDFTKAFLAANKKSFSERELNEIFSTYTTLITPSFSSSKTIDRLMGRSLAQYPLEQLKEESFYQSRIEKFLNSENPNHRILGYITVASANDSTFKATLRARLKTEENTGAKFWLGTALIYLRDIHTTELFDFIVENENFSDSHLIPLFIGLDADSLRQTAYNRINSADIKAKILAIQILSATGLNIETDKLVRHAVDTWDIKIKGYAIFAIKTLKMGNLKSILEPLIKQQETRRITIEALAGSPTPEDRAFLESLVFENGEISTDVLDGLLKSSDETALGKWLKIVREQKIPDNYIFFVFDKPLLSSDKLLPQVRETIRKTPNLKILQELPRVLKGRKDDESIDLLISLLKNENSTVRYWAGHTLQGSQSSRLVSILPELIRDTTLRTTALIDLAIENNVRNLQETLESYWVPNESKELYWRRSSIEYLAAFPLEKHKLLFQKILKDKKVDTFIKRNAAQGLAELKDMESVDLIIEVIEAEVSSDYNVITYLIALGKIKGDKAKSVIMRFINSKEEQTKKVATEIIDKW